MIIDLFKNNKTLRGLIYGIILYGIVVEVILLIFTERKCYYSIGMGIGILMSIICAVHMAWGIDIAVCLDEKSSIALTRKYTVIRYLLLCIVLGAVGISDIGSPVTLIAGYMGLKMGAYLYPLIHIITKKLFGGDEE